MPYQEQTVCDPVARPGVRRVRPAHDLALRDGLDGLIGRTCGSGPSEHYDGRAWDWMLNVDNPSQEAVAQSVLAWLTAPDKNGVKGAMARRFGIMYIIHNRKMWRSYATERGLGAVLRLLAPHRPRPLQLQLRRRGRSHVVVDGRRRRRSYLTSLPPAATTLPTTPPSTPTPSTPGDDEARRCSRYGMRSEAVRQLQVRLGNLPTTGYFGDQTKARVIAYQTLRRAAADRRRRPAHAGDPRGPRAGGASPRPTRR